MSKHSYGFIHSRLRLNTGCYLYFVPTDTKNPDLRTAAKTVLVSDPTPPFDLVNHSATPRRTVNFLRSTKRKTSSTVTKEGRASP